MTRSVVSLALILCLALLGLVGCGGEPIDEEQETGKAARAGFSRSGGTMWVCLPPHTDYAAVHAAAAPLAPAYCAERGVCYDRHYISSSSLRSCPGGWSYPVVVECLPC